MAPLGRIGRNYDQPVSRSLLERRLTEVSDRLRQLREELRVADEQLAHFADEADDARLRALVSETPLAEQEHREAQKHADAMGRHRADVLAEIDASSSAPRTTCSTAWSRGHPRPGPPRPTTFEPTRGASVADPCRDRRGRGHHPPRPEGDPRGGGLRGRGRDRPGRRGRRAGAGARARRRHPRHQDAGPRRPVGRPGDRRRAPGRGADPHRVQPARPHRAGPRRRGAGLPGQAVPEGRPAARPSRSPSAASRR